MLADFHFLRPYYLLALIPACIFFLLLVKNKLRQGDWSAVCDTELLPYILQDNAVATKHRWMLSAFFIASILSIIALAGPTWERISTPSFRNDAAVVIALDLSQSMNSSDIKPSRLIRARYKIEDMLNARKDGLTALLVYAGDAFTVTPLTTDTKTISSQLNALTTDIMPSQGSNTLAAVTLAKSLLQQAGQRQGDIILVTDGVPTNVEQHISKLLAGHYRLSILGIGTDDGTPIQLKSGGFLKDKQGNIVVPKLNSGKLAALAHSEHGLYQTISNDNHDIHTLMNGLLQPHVENKTSSKAHLVETWDEKGPWLLLLTLPLAALFFRKGLLVLPFLVLLHFPQESQAFGWQDLWQTPDQQAQQAFKQQHYQQAAKQFHSPEWKAVAHYKSGQYQQALSELKTAKSADGYYNQGNALAKMGKLKQALEAYQHALKLQPEDKDTLYNKKLVEQALKKQQQNKHQDKNKQSKSPQSNKDKNKQKKSQQSNKDKNKQGKSQSNSQQQNSAQQKDKSSAGAQQSHSTPQKNDNNKKQQNQTEKSDLLSQKEQQKLASEEKKSAQQNTESKNKKTSITKPQQAQTNTESEQEQQKQAAQAQWLKRIPDDPSGLLKRKFKYLYNQRHSNQSQQDQAW